MDVVEPRARGRGRARRLRGGGLGLRRAGAGRPRRAACTTRCPRRRRTWSRAIPALIVFTSGTAGEPKPIRHGHGYLAGQRVQAEHWFGARPGDLCWCTAASGWSKSARNVFVAPWLRGAAALLHDARFDPDERLDILARERVDVLCMAPTEYRVIAKRAELRRLPDLRHAVAAGEPLNPEVVRTWSEAAGVQVHDGYGQTETGTLTGMPIGPPVRPGSMGTPLPGFRMWIDEGELCVDPETVPTFFLDGPRTGPWRTGDRVRAGRGRLPVVRGPHRRRDHLGRVPDRAVRGGVRARVPPGGGGGRRRGRARRGARPGRACRGRPARRARAPATSWRASSRSTCARRPRPTSTRASSSSPTRCRRRRAARSSAPSCAAARPG